MDGPPVDLVRPGARHVVGLLWDGAPHADLLALAADGALPNVARLLARGCALRGGAVAEFPSVTLVNHTCALTGVGPGRHGIVHNAYFDRATGEQVVPNSSDSWHRAMRLAAARACGPSSSGSRPAAAVSACVNEPVDRGAGCSHLRAGPRGGVGGTGSAVGLAAGRRSTTRSPRQQHVRVDADYAWATQVDASGLEQVLGLWRDGESRPG